MRSTLRASVGRNCLIALYSLVVVSCSGSETDSLERESDVAVKVTAASSADGDHSSEKEGFVTGYVDQSVLAELEDFAPHGDHWSTDEQAVAALKTIETPITLLAFFGTWCHDSQREIPRLIETLEEVSNPNISLRLYALDASKSDPENLSQTFAVRYTPTIVVLAGTELEGKSSQDELGRIVETPEQSLGADLVKILGADLE